MLEEQCSRKLQDLLIACVAVVQRKAEGPTGKTQEQNYRPGLTQAEGLASITRLATRGVRIREVDLRGCEARGRRNRLALRTVLLPHTTILLYCAELLLVQFTDVRCCLTEKRSTAKYCNHIY